MNVRVKSGAGLSRLNAPAKAISEANKPARLAAQTTRAAMVRMPGMIGGVGSISAISAEGPSTTEVPGLNTTFNGAGACHRPNVARNPWWTTGAATT